MSETPEYSYAESLPPPKKQGIPTWVIIAGAAVLLCLGAVGLAVGLFVCLGPLVGLTLLGPTIGNQFTVILAGIGCQVENPGLTADQCTAWAEDAAANYPSAIQSCQGVASSSDNNSDGTEYYDCLIDQGVPPPQ